MRVDFHTHPVLLREYVGADANLQKAVREVFHIGNNLQPIETFHLQMDAAGIDKAVLLPIDCERTQGVSIFSNEQIAEICRKYGRFLGFASVDPNDPMATTKLENAIRKLKLRGLKLAPELQYFYPNDQEKAYPLFETAQMLKIPILFHSGLSWEPAARLKYSHPLLLEDVAADFPGLKIILAHLGWPWVEEAAILALKYSNVYIDTSSLYFGDPLEFLNFIFTRRLPVSVIENSLCDKMLFGSNYPRIEIHKMVDAIKNLGLSGKCLDKILGENAQSVLGGLQE